MCKTLWGLSWHWEMLTLSEISFILHLYCFDLHFSSCVFGCVNVLLPRHNRILVVDHLCLQFIFIPISLITYWPPIYILLVWQDAVYIPEGKLHFHGASTGYSILQTGFTGIVHRLHCLQVFDLPHGDHIRQKKWLSQRALSLLRGRRDLQGVKSQAEIKLRTELPVGAGTGGKCQDPRAIQVKYSVDTGNEIWVSGSYSHFLMSLLKYSS